MVNQPTDEHRKQMVVSMRSVLERHWQAAGYTIPSEDRYPWQWLWDSAFHAVLWVAFDRMDRALAELESSLSTRGADGFVPHMIYRGAAPHAELWGRVGTSSITQPPIFCHALGVLHRSGVSLPEELVDAAAAAVRHLLEDRDRIDGLVVTVHPWETGADDSPRWDHWFDQHTSRYTAKGSFVAAIDRTGARSPRSNDRFVCAAVSFNAQLAFGARELTEVSPGSVSAAAIDELVDSLDARWDDSLATWVDAGEAADSSGRVRTLDALLPSLVVADSTRWAAVRAQLLDETQFDSPMGPAGVHRAERAFLPRAYWRGSAWPQLTYLLALAAHRHDDAELFAHLRHRAWAGASASGLAEHHDPLTGDGLGARPQSWAALPVAIDRLAGDHTRSTGR